MRLLIGLIGVLGMFAINMYLLLSVDSTLGALMFICVMLIAIGNGDDRR